MKNFNLENALSAAISNSSVEEVKLLAGQSITLHCEFVFSVSHDCVVDLDSLLLSKRAFIRTLKRCLAKQAPKTPINL